MRTKAAHPRANRVKKFCLAAAILFFAAPGLRAQLNAWFVNVGQGDAAYIELPNGSNVLIDGGPSAAPIHNFLKAKGVTAIDHVVLTHPHSDHYRGLETVFSSFAVKNFYDTRAENVDTQGDNDLRELAKAEPSCKVHYPVVGTMLDWDKNVTIKVLNTCSDPVLSRGDVILNNCSIVLRFYYNGSGLLMMGDAEAAVENAIMRVFKSGLSSTYLKVSHHGSRYSSTNKFLARVQPRVAIISAGPDNNYGHPHKEALDRLQASGAQIFTTLGGTQSLSIPAPKAGVEPLMNGEMDLGPISLPETLKFNMLEERPENTGSAALGQLEEAAQVK